jgi:hypothetical protein
MAHLITGTTISDAWLAALQALADQGGKEINLSVVITEPSIERLGIRSVLDLFLREHRQQSVHTVANTIFPQTFYRGAGPGHRTMLYRHYLDHTYPILQRRWKNKYGTYFQRLIAYPGPDGPVNQLEAVIVRLQHQLSRPGPLSSAYELGVSAAGDTGLEFRVQCPGKDTRTMGFPCLSHVSLTLEGKRLHLTATYRNQYFITRAYGNYVGLSRVLSFLCAETGCIPGELYCIATHADAEFSLSGIGKRGALDLLAQCEGLLLEEQREPEDIHLQQERRNGKPRDRRAVIGR